MTKFEEELSNLLVSKSTNYTEFWNKAQLLTVFKDWQPQQALPVVPEDVAKWIEDLKSKGYSPLKNPVTYGESISDLSDESLEKILTWISQHQEEFMRAWLDGFKVEKPQLFKLIFPNSTAVLQKDGELNSFADTVYKRYLIENAMTEQEIKSVDERYWQFAVPVEDGE